MDKHAMLSPSGAHKWLKCAGSVALEQQSPKDGSRYADEGTVAHTVAAKCLTTNVDAVAYKGDRVSVGYATIEVDQEMVEYVQEYVNSIREYALGNHLLVEQKLPISHITGEPGAEGTGDALVIADGGQELQVHDLKYGRGVRVEAYENPQLMMYALGALELVSLIGYSPVRVRLVIHQPRICKAPSEWDCSVERLLEFGVHASEKAKVAFEALTVFPLNEWKNKPQHEYLQPGDHCSKAFCKARATCPALRQKVINTVADDFVDVSTPDSKVIEQHVSAAMTRITESDMAHLSELMPNLDMIEDWVRSVRKRVHDELKAGRIVPGYKLVAGRQGPRAWSNESEVEAILKSMRMRQDEIYTFKLISPTQAEKIFKDKPKRWAQLEDKVVRNDGAPMVVPESDKRQSLHQEAVDFTEV